MCVEKCVEILGLFGNRYESIRRRILSVGVLCAGILRESFVRWHNKDKRALITFRIVALKFVGLVKVISLGKRSLRGRGTQGQGEGRRRQLLPRKPSARSRPIKLASTRGGWVRSFFPKLFALTMNVQQHCSKFDLVRRKSVFSYYPHTYFYLRSPSTYVHNNISL
jgi:hypothetical protein